MENNFDLRNFLYNNPLVENLDLKASEVEETSTKMSKKALKEKIRGAIMDTLSEEDKVDEAEDDEAGDDLDAALDAAEDEVDGDEESPIEEPAGDGVEGPEPDLSDEAGLSDEETEIQKALKMAYDNAVSLGDEKLKNQIANTITFFTRAHVAPTT